MSDYTGYVDPKVGPDRRCGHCGCPLVWMRSTVTAGDAARCPIDGWPESGYDQPPAEIIGIFSRRDG